MTQPAPNMASDLIRIHKVITRAIGVDLHKGIEYQQNGFKDPQELLGYSSYTHCLVQVLDSHHHGEDMIVFPELKKVLPSAPYARLTAEHLQVERLLDKISPAVEKLSSELQEGLQVIVDTLRKLSTLWPPHYQLEEKNFSAEVLNPLVSLEDQRRISETSSRYSQEHSEPPYWVVPFILYNLELEDRTHMAANFPPVIIEELVPKAWKEQWAPMKPLLLE